jgi:hypothetical protein
MSADLMRRAATKVRATAAAASTGPWDATVLGSEGYDVRAQRPPTAGRLSRLRVARCGYEDWETDKANAEHIASWDPTVARAVADLLDAGADEIARRVARDGVEVLERANPVFHAMTELARTYLREDS